MDASLLDLTDDALLAVLSPGNLLRCRVVCRRLRDLCLHRHLWQSAAVGRELLPALRVAPCLRTLSIDTRYPKLTPAMAIQILSLMANTTCIVAELEVFVSTILGVAFATALVEKFSALGGLRSLNLNFSHQIDISLAASLLKVAFSVIDLHELTIYPGMRPPQRPALWRSKMNVRRPSLTRLHYYGKGDPFLEMLLKTHAATLEVVSLIRVHHLPIDLLKSLPRLRSLECVAKDGLPHLEALSNLDTLKLCTKGHVPFHPTALDFLSRAPRLRSVTFHLPYGEERVAPLRALASSPSARCVEILTLRSSSLEYLSSDLVGLELAAHILPHFPSLQSLSVGYGLQKAALDSFLRAVTPTSAPSLTSLLMSPAGCVHAWLHSPVVQDLLQRNPRLHLRAEGGTSVGCGCEWCRQGCHVELQKSDYLERLALAAHRRVVGCPGGCRRWP